MCGLVGVMGNITYKEDLVFNQLLLVDTLRGKHSTGVALVSAGGDVDVFKKAVNAIDFMDFKTYSSLLKCKYNCMLGHNRYATKGSINNVNAHPFEFDTIVGMHNGTLKSYTKLDDSVDFDVDSECLYSHINDNSIQDAVDKITGAYALTWFNKETNKLHFLRNDERPLCYCYNADGTTLYWASEAWMLRSILSRNDIKHNDIMDVTPDVLYTFEVPKQYATANFKLAAPHVCKTVKKLPPKKSNIGYLPAAKKQQADLHTYESYTNQTVEFCVNDAVRDIYQAYYIEGFIFNDTAKNIRIYTPEFSNLAKELIDKRDDGNFTGTVRRYTSFNKEDYLILDMRTVAFIEPVEDVKPPVYRGFRDEVLTEQEFNKATCQGCVWCGNPVDVNTEVTFIDCDEFICESCKAHPEITECVNYSYGSQL